MSVMDSISAIDPSLKIATIVEGKAMSCGAVLFSCGHEGYRYVAKNATVMIHEVSSFAYGKNEEIKASVKEADRLNEKVFAIMAKNCGHEDPNYFLNLVSKRKHADWYLDSNECIEHNLANKIGMPKFKVDINLSVDFIDAPNTVVPVVAKIESSSFTKKKK